MPEDQYACLRGRCGFEHRRAARRAANRPRAALAVGELNNATDTHFGRQSFVTQRFRAGELRKRRLGRAPFILGPFR